MLVYLQDFWELRKIRSCRSHGPRIALENCQDFLIFTCSYQDLLEEAGVNKTFTFLVGFRKEGGVDVVVIGASKKGDRDEEK